MGASGDGAILVTGGAGYLGSALVARLLQAGETVVVLDPLLYGGGALDELRCEPGFSLYDNPTNRDEIERAFAGVTRVVHMGAVVGDSACTLDEAFTYSLNVDATRLLIETAKERGVSRFVFASTCSVYGAGESELDERSPLAPKSLYARTKIDGEGMVLATPGIGPVVLRFGTVFGASRRPRFDLVVNLLAAKAWAREPVVIHGGDQWRPFVHVEDIATAIVMALDAPDDAVAGEVFNVGSAAENRRLREVGEAIACAVPGANVAIEANSPDARDYRADFRKIKERLGFSAAWTLQAGIEQVIAQLESGRIADFRAAAHSNERALAERLGRGAGLGKIAS